MTDTNNTADLEGLRAQLDEMDGRLLRTVHDRIKLCIQIAEYKRDHNVPMMQPQRIQAVHEHVTAFAAEHGINTVFLNQLYDAIIKESCRVENEIIGVSTT